MFNINDCVICIDASIQPHMVEEVTRDCPNWVKQNEKYTIRGFCDNDGIVTGVLLEEIINPIRFFRLIGRNQESAFKLDRFRKLEESELEVSVEKDEEILVK